jgi:hypothetical protein
LQVAGTILAGKLAGKGQQPKEKEMAKDFVDGCNDVGWRKSTAKAILHICRYLP